MFIINNLFQFSIIQKSQIYKTVSTFCKDFDIDYSFMPVTFAMNDTNDRIAFFSKLPCDGTHLWVFKTNVHQGKGLYTLILILHFNDILIQLNFAHVFVVPNGRCCFGI